MNCAAHTTPPLPQTSRKMPMIAALRNSTQVGFASPASRREMTKNVPEIPKRAAAEINGGIVSTVNRIAR